MPIEHAARSLCTLPVAGGGNGAITGDTVTIDSLLFRGNGDATVFIDAVSYNAEGSLLPPPGDFDLNLDVGAADLAVWQASHGVDGQGDANGDGTTDGADFLIWQRAASAPTASGGTAASIPEPAAIVLVCAGSLASVVVSRVARR